MRFNIRSLLIVTIYVAVGCAALVKATEAWASAVVTLAVATLLAAAVIGVAGRGSRRAFGGSFALAGIGYLAMVYAPGAAENIGPHLATTKALNLAVKQIYGEEALTYPISFSPDGRRLITSGGDSIIRLWDPYTIPNRSITAASASDFVRIGQCLWALVIGCLGGLVGQFFYARSERQEHSEQRLSPIVSRLV